MEARAFSELRLLNRSVVITLDGIDKFNVGASNARNLELVRSCGASPRESCSGADFCEFGSYRRLVVKFPSGERSGGAS